MKEGEQTSSSGFLETQSPTPFLLVGLWEFYANLFPPLESSVRLKAEHKTRGITDQTDALLVTLIATREIPRGFKRVVSGSGLVILIIECHCHLQTRAVSSVDVTPVSTRAGSYLPA
jgi:hypothetical protein